MLDRSAVKFKIASVLQVQPELIVEEAILNELVVDSFILVDLVIELQEEFSCRLNQENLKSVRTVGDLIQQLELHRFAAA
ncbi:MAG: acyl carrier protein [Candidatus Obscuribacterales bacterium]|nr:acyl carrier protein [Candidatus Obscuribacterales bacterium]